MRNAAKTLILLLGAAGFAACSRSSGENEAANQDIGLESNFAEGQLPPNAEIETLPPDESSETTSGELNAGDDNPDVNDLGNSH